MAAEAGAGEDLAAGVVSAGAVEDLEDLAEAARAAAAPGGAGRNPVASSQLLVAGSQLPVVSSQKKQILDD